MSFMQSILRAIYSGTHTPTAPLATVPPLASPDAAVLASNTPGGALPPPPALTSQPPQSRGVLGTIGDVLAPQAGSFWASALAHGLAGAHQGMIDDPLAHAAEVAKVQQAQGTAQTAVATGAMNKAGLHESPTGGWTRVDPSNVGSPVTSVFEPPSPTQKLIEAWKGADPATRRLIEQALPGYRWTEPVIDAVGNAKTRTGVAIAGAKKFAPRAAPQAKPPF